jgi:hypothetical protein
MQAARDYVDDMYKKFGFTRVSNLKYIPEDASVPELRRLFPITLHNPFSAPQKERNRATTNIQEPE